MNGSCPLADKKINEVKQGKRKVVTKKLNTFSRADQRTYH
jgi:hypothetical protein